MKLCTRLHGILAIALAAMVAHAQGLATDKPFVPSNRWALVIGASAYRPDVGPLKYTSKEARDFANLLTGPMGFDEGNVKLLADGGTPEEAPTSQNILSSLDALLNDPKLDKGNLFVFYFSGHGIGTKDGDFLLPSDATPDQLEKMGVPVEEVVQRIVKAGLKNVLFIADACRAGQANDFGSQLIELCRKANLAVILGCEPGKRSYEYSSLKSGAFTHFLIQSFQDPSLRDASGTLWASRVGQAVQKEVHDYTEPDYGKFAQTPAVWSEQSTLDVLLATYPQKPVSDVAIKAFQQSASKLNKQQFAAAMTAYAAQLESADQEDQCIEILKAVDQLGELTPLGRYILGNSLSIVGRKGEASRVFAAFDSMPDSYYKDLALVSSDSRSTPPTKRVEAANRILQTDSWPAKMLANLCVEQCGTYEQMLDFTRRFAATKMDPREKLYAQACLAELEGKWSESIYDFKRAMQTPGEYPKDRELYIGMLDPTVATNDPRAVEAWADKGLKVKGCENICYLEKASLAKSAGDIDSRTALLKKVLDNSPDPSQVWRAASIAGPALGPLKDDFLQAAELHPYSWHMRLLTAFIKQLNGDPAAMDDLAKSALYRDDELTFASESLGLMTSLLEEGVATGKVPESAYRTELELTFLGLLNYVSDFGYDPDLWGQFISAGMTNERNTQIQLLLKAHIPYQPEAVPIGLRPLLFLNALNVGDTQMVEKLNAVAYEPAEGDDEKWLYAAFLATKGREKEALAMTKRLRTPTERLAPRMEAMRAYLLAQQGQRSAAIKLLNTPHPKDLVIDTWHGLAWAALDDWKKAERLLAEQIKLRDWAFLFATAKANAVLDDHYRKQGRLAEAREIAYMAGESQPANPLFDRFSFVTKPGVSQFAGNVKMDCVIEDDVLCAKSMGDQGQKTFAFGQLQMTILPSGVVTGSFSDEQKNDYPFSGKIDGLGNFRGKSNIKGRSFTVAAKLAPAPLYAKFADFKNPGQVIEFVDAQGYRVVVIAHT